MPTKLIDEAALAEIEAVLTSGDSQAMYMVASIDNTRALAATIRRLWAERLVPPVLVGDEVITYRDYAEGLLRRYRKQGEALQEAFETIERLRTPPVPVDARAWANNDFSQYEDQLPPDMPQADYDKWFTMSKVDGVRIGPKYPFEQPAGERYKAVAESIAPLFPLAVRERGTQQIIAAITTYARHHGEERYRAAIDDVLQVLVDERVDANSSKNAEDYAYNGALADATRTIRATLLPQREEQGGG